MLFCKVILLNNSQSFSNQTDNSLTYSIPDELSENIAVGFFVFVPLLDKVLTALVIEILEDVQAEFKIKEIIDLIDPKIHLNRDLIEIIKYTGDYYATAYSQVLSTVINTANIPNAEKEIYYLNLNIEETQKKSKAKDERESLDLRLGNLTDSVTLDVLEKLKNCRGQKAKFNRLKALCKIPTKKLNQALAKLQSQSLLEIKYHYNFKTEAPQRNYLDKFEDYDFNKKQDEICQHSINHLSAEQAAAYQCIKENSNKKINPTKKFLIHGITGSGKTEIYFELIQDTLKKQQSAIILVPEISLAPQLIDRLKQRFPDQEILIWHSALDEQERLYSFMKLMTEESVIVVGARSAIFSPVTNLSLIIMDEEHENSYKQDQPAPRYHTRNIAEKRAELNNALLVLGSATPCVESYQKAACGNPDPRNIFTDTQKNGGVAKRTSSRLRRTNDRSALGVHEDHEDDENAEIGVSLHAQQTSSNWMLLHLKKRYNQSPLPSVEIVDMKEEFNLGNKSIFSKKLRELMEDRLNKGEATILFLNKRGNSSHVFCRNCGYIYKCSHCDSKMVYHSDKHILICHLCNHSEKHPDSCPACGSSSIKYFGLGTQKLEEEVRKAFPTAKVARLDSDTTKKKNYHLEVFQKFKNQEINILIGTQMIAKGLDNPLVTCVGVIAADSCFTQLDYQAEEKGFQLLTQVSGRAGRKDREGKVIFQSYLNNRPSLLLAQEQDYEKFYAEEIKLREEFNYPPFSKLIRFISSSEDEVLAINNINKFHELIYDYFTETIKETAAPLQLLGPSQCQITKINKQYRYHLLCKIALNRADIESNLKSLFLNHKALHRTRLVIDIDSCSLF
ncbi:MAG: primosomal protein N' [Candidatus Melainabacteria bacterium]|nr:primosomal protein N' [Candidatus Melainabacteria bacterium]